jgi:hypothetical protein
MVPAAPGRIAGYEILGELGRGGMGVVYRARQTKLDRLVALKMILAGSHAGTGEFARFRMEAESVARLCHPNIVQIYDVGEHEGQPFFALEYVEGGNLAGRVKDPPLSPRRAAELVELLARAIDHAHQHGIIHRDLKPANVLMTAEGQPKITDFGLAKRLDGGQGYTQSGAIVGTPSYMAPEQAAGKSKAIGPAADVYALGAILYDLLTGRPPFQADTAMDTVLQVLGEEPLPVRQRQPAVPRDLETVCLKCLQKEPAKRYVSAAALAEDLRRFLVGESIQARRVGRLERAWRWCRRNRAVAGLSAGVGLLLTMVLAYTLFFIVVLMIQPRKAEDLPKQPGKEASPDELLQVVEELNRLDPGWRLEHIEARRKVIPPERNAALRMEAARRRFPPKWDEGPQPVLQALGELVPVTPLSEPQVEGFRTLRNRMAPALAEARLLADLPEGRHQVPSSRDWISTLASHAQGAREVANLLELDALLQAHEGEAGRALASCRGALNAGRSLGDEPSAISQLVRISCGAAAVRRAEWVLARGEAPADALAALQELLVREAVEPMLLTMARGERGGMHHLFAAIETGDMSLRGLAPLFGSKEPLTPEAIERLSASARPGHVWLLRHLTRFIEIAGLPPHEQEGPIAEWYEARKEAPDLGRLFLVDGPKLVRAYHRHLALTRCAAAALAAERHRLLTGAWPESLAALLGEVPADPYDGAPLRYRRLADGVVVYAVGPDRRDDQGRLDRKNPGREGTDLGFQLWDVAERGRTVRSGRQDR